MYFFSLLKLSNIALIFKITGVALGFLFSLLIANKYGPSVLGVYTLALNLFHIAVTLSLVGLDTALVKYIASFGKDLNKTRGLHKKSLAITAITSVSISFFLYQSAGYISLYIFKNIDLKLFIEMFSIVILPFTFLKVNLSIVRACRKTLQYSLLEYVSVFVFAIIIFLLLEINRNNSINIVTSQVTAYFITLIISLIYIYKSIYRENLKISNNIESLALLKTSLPMLMVTSISMVVAWTDIFILGIFKDDYTVGLYSVAIKISTTMSFGLMAINVVVAPLFSKEFANKKYRKLIKLLSNATKISAFFGIFIGVLLLLFSDMILSFFGSEFIAVKDVLYILIVSQIFNTASGPIFMFMNMTGHHSIVLKIYGFVSIVNGLMSYVFVINYGMAGVAIATCISSLLQQVLGLFFKNRVIKIDMTHAN